MTGAAWAMFGLAGVAAALDWTAVYLKRKRLEYAAKPAVMVFLITAVILLDGDSDGSRRMWFILALAASLAGDIFLMLPRDRFIFGLASFLVAHIAYAIGFAIAFRSVGVFVGALVAIGILDFFLLRPIVRATSRSRPSLTIPVIAYTVAISAMVCTAYATKNLLAAAGATLFMFSDFMIARHRLVQAVSWAPIAIIVTYHLGQAGLVLSLTG